MRNFLIGLLTGLVLGGIWYVAYESTQQCETDLECELRYGE